MSAVAPTPPPHTVPVPPTSTGAVNGRQPREPSMASNGGRGGPSRPPYPHVKDLLAQAQAEVAQTAHTPINRLIDMADASCRQAVTLLEWNKPAMAYKEYLAANLFVAEAIPRHKDFPAASQHPRLSVVFKSMIKRINEHHATFDSLGDEISQDNVRNGTVQKSANLKPQTSPAKLQKARPVSTQAPHPELSRPHNDDSTHRHSVVPQYSKDSPTGPQVPPRPRPRVSTTPQQAQQNPSTPAPPVNAADALSDRFARLRMPHGGTSMAVSGQASPQAASPVDDSLQRPASSYAKFGSRMPPGQPRPLPAPPTPTYTPSRAPPAAPQARPSWSAADSSERPASRNSDSSATSYQNNNWQPQTAGTVSQSSTFSDGQSRSGERRRRHVASGPVEKEITAQLLYDYLRTFTVMLIDVRTREEYDYGHIMAASSICIEPAALRQNMSAEDLEEALVLSPDNEQACFQRREQFDLIVYYDDGTGPDSTTAPLRYLYEALADFNDEKPLSHPPILLSGGLQAWTDMVGTQALQSSNTVARMGNKARPIARRPLATHSAKLGIQRRKRRDYNPLDPEEERKWRERARSESLVLDAQIQHEGPAESEDGDEEAPYSPSYQDFQQRFPDLGALSQQQARYEQPPARPPPQIPHYPTPPPSTYASPPPPSYPSHAPPLPPVPARPPPAMQRPSYSGVSERIVSPTVTTASQQLAPYIPPKLRRLPKTGLHNFSVTCYMNATIQCMSATLPLTAFFLDNQFMKFIQKDNWKGSKGVLPELYATLVKNLWLANDVDTIRPTNFRKFCARLNKEWGIDRQQDAKEFLEFLIDCLHEDFNIHWQRTPLRALTEAEEARRERQPTLLASKTEWERYLHRDHSKLTDLFAGQHISRLTCTTCHHSSTTYEPFYSISVEIPKVPRQVSIYDCLKSYCSEEKLSGDEVWRCPNCKTEREATKRITITRVPEFLVVHFKRFSASHSERARKITTPIDFPLEDLDMDPFVNPLPPTQQLKDLLSRDANLMTPAVTAPFKYEAYAVMRHIGGTLTSGHYIALVRDRARGLWREFNDSRVTDFRPENLSAQYGLQNEQAYIVFYQRTM
ncbi:hypothetical protein FH972_023205 [Carpinus fangiana]|uniref:USP domain-containing protein n=1 Tax=Carpinus fangiana TaxID=176857 RepID=A0A5N6KUI8_9ROSI|nr:hypothetical protein FH972_023205 [Carpinus fangiana]